MLDNSLETKNFHLNLWASAARFTMLISTLSSWLRSWVVQGFVAGLFARLASTSKWLAHCDSLIFRELNTGLRYVRLMRLFRLWLVLNGLFLAAVGRDRPRFYFLLTAVDSNTSIWPTRLIKIINFTASCGPSVWDSGVFMLFLWLWRSGYCFLRSVNWVCWSRPFWHEWLCLSFSFYDHLLQFSIFIPQLLYLFNDKLQIIVLGYSMLIRRYLELIWFWLQTVVSLDHIYLHVTLPLGCFSFLVVRN